MYLRGPRVCARLRRCRWINPLLLSRLKNLRFRLRFTSLTSKGAQYVRLRSDREPFRFYDLWFTSAKTLIITVQRDLDFKVQQFILVTKGKADALKM